jgi:hypothetical protein
VEIEGDAEGPRNGRRHWKIGGEQRKQHVWVGFFCAFDKNTLFFLYLFDWDFFVSLLFGISLDTLII